MKRIYMGPGAYRYEKEEQEILQESVLSLAKMQAQQLDDDKAAEVPGLFDLYEPGVTYTEGQRIRDGEGNLYRVVQGHTAQENWPINGTPALYTPLGITAENPEEIPQWRQPAGAHDAYNTGDKVSYQGKVYVCTCNANVYAPGVYGWKEAE